MRRYSLGSLVLLVTSIALAVGWSASGSRWRQKEEELYRLLGAKARTPNEPRLRYSPVTIVASEDGYFGVQSSWDLSVNGAGWAHLETPTLESKNAHDFQLSAVQLDELRDLLIKEKFFELDGDYGENVPDGTIQTLTVAIGDELRTVRILFLGNWLNQAGHDEELKKAGRALRVWLAIRDWFNYPEAVGSRSYDRQLLKVIESRP